MGPFQSAAQHPPQIPAPQMPPQGQQGINPQMAQMLKMAAGMGRNGDSLLAHLTPGEKTVPPEIQTPKVLATLDKAYKDKGVSPEQFTAGSPQSSMNPQTGLPEYNFLSSFLPMALGLAGSVAMPALAPAMAAASPMATAALGSGLGTTIGGLAAGQKPLQAGLSGLGAGAGGYMLGNLFQPAAQAAGQAGAQAGGQAGAQAAGQTAGQAGHLSQTFNGIPGAQPAPFSTRLSNSFMNAATNPNLPSMIGGGIGGQIGSYLGAPPAPSRSPRPKGFDDRMGPTPPWDQALGQTTYNGPTANFNGYNPATNYPASWRFF